MSTVLSTRLKLWFAVAAVALVASFALRYAIISNVVVTERQATGIRDAIGTMDALIETLEDAQSGQLKYLVTGNERFLKAYHQARDAIDTQLGKVAEAIDADSAKQQERLQELRRAVADRMADLAAAVQRPPAESLEAAKNLIDADAGLQLMRLAENKVAAMKAHEETRLEKSRQKATSAEHLNWGNFVGLAAFNLLLLGLLFNAVRLDAVERGKAKAVLEQQEQRLRRVVDSNVIGIAFADFEGRLNSANDAFLQLIGYGREDLEAGVIQRAAISAPEYADRTERALAEVRRTGKCAPYEKEYVRKDGSRVPVLVGVARIEDAGQIVIFVLDLTEHREAEAARAKLMAILESSNDAIISQTPDGIITAWNTGAERLFGFAPNEVIGRPLSLLVPPGAEAEHAYLLDRLRHGNRVEHFKTLRLAKDGSPIDVSLTIFPVCDADGHVTGAAKIVRDITADKRAEIERERLLAAERAARAEAERIGHVKDEFLATLSHELRTPLNVILGWIHLLTTSRMGPEETAQALQIIQRSARSQTQLIEDLLDMSRIISGKLRMDVQRVEVATIIDAAIESVRPAAEAKGLRLVKVLDPATGPVMGDPNRLQQVVWNLLANAVKFTPRGGRVQTRLTQCHAHVEIEVSDTGQGIPLEFLPHVFERFRQADASTTRRHTGLGLGLAIVRHLVELHGGSVIVLSAGEGRGASFTVSLPALEPEEIDEGRRDPLAAPLESDDPDCVRPRLAGVRVLVVDDERESRELVRRLLEECDASVVTAASAAEALAMLRQSHPAVLLSDIGMPDEDGYALIRRVRQLPAHEGGQIPAAALTAFARSEDRDRTLSCGFQMHLSKPVEPSALLAAVASLAGRRAAGKVAHIGA
ncbi:MAG TPA: PAS domain S-box protein [Pirellulales bacterium]|jgi:PAS domain S-box-containing protein|nr:PAS domain S-box protein [Pirellulales bacterium]